MFFLTIGFIKSASAQIIFDNRGNSRLTETLKGNTDSVRRIILAGTVLADNNNPVAYASIGIPSADCGTVADKNGNFYLKIDKKLLGKVISISALNFNEKKFNVKDLAAVLSYNPIIILSRQVNQLQEVVIVAKKDHSKIIGNTSRSKSISIGFPLRDLGSELGIRLSLGKKPVLLRSFNFNISQIRLDTCTFRLNIYTVKNRMPAENLLTQNILIGIGNKSGAYKIDLMPYKLIMSGDVIVSLEWVSGKTLTNNGSVFFSAELLSSCYHRKTTAATWTQLKGIGAGFNLQVVDCK